MQIVVEPLTGLPIAEQGVEIVERKGLGHPDSICDGVMEAVSAALSRVYLEEFGAVLHHNIDKGMLIAGQAEKWFGGGRVLQPMELIIGDRAAFGLEGKEIPVAEIAERAARGWFARHLRHLDAERDLKVRVVLAPGSAELADIFTRPGEVHGANDTSAAAGYYPLSPAEEAVLKMERWLNSAEFKERFPETGEDVKIMGVRHHRTLDLTVAMPLMCSLIGSEEDYFTRKAEILREMQQWIGRTLPFTAGVNFNALDEPGRGLGGVYLSLLGTSAEDADSGQVGRGNRLNGVIPVNRPISTEAVAGKNPVSHVGKIYNVFAQRAARTIYHEIPGLREVHVSLVSRIGQPVDRPLLAAAQIVPEPGREFAPFAGRVEAIMERQIAQIAELCRQLSGREILDEGRS